MKIAIWILPSLLLLGSASVLAAGDRCLENASSQSQINTCMASDFAKLDAELNAVYRDVRSIHADDAEFLEKLKLAQRAWLAYRDAEVEARYPASDTALEYGSAYPGCVANVKVELTRARIIQLKRWIEGVEEGDVCAGSIPAKDYH